MKKFYLTIKPQIPPEHRHKIEDVLKKLGYHVAGGGQSIVMEPDDMSFSDISFRTKKEKEVI